MPLPDGLERRLLDKRWPVRELAAPPPGSGLRPVMGDAGAPVIGHTFELIHFGPDYHLRRQQSLGPVSWVGAFGRRIVVLSGPDAAQAALTNGDKALSQDGWDYFIGRFFGARSDAAELRRAPPSSADHAGARSPATGSPGMCGRWAPVLRTGIGGWPADGRRFRLFPAIKRLTLDVATRVFMDMDTDEDREQINRAFVATVRAGTAFVRYPVPGGRWAAGLSGRTVLERYFAAHLDAKRRADHGDLFSALCHATTDDGHQFTDTDVINHMIFLMMAAHDTTTITSTAAAYYLAKHPEWQERAREESLRLDDAAPDIPALEQLHTLDLVIKEALRLVPPVPSLARQTVTDTAILGHFIPAGTLVSLSPSSCHLSAEHWSRSPGIRSGTLQRRSARGQESPLRVDTVRRRRTQVHRPAFRHAGGQGPPPRDAADLHLVDPERLHGAVGPHVAAGAGGRPPVRLTRR